jgi:hypothetical protein
MTKVSFLGSLFRFLYGTHTHTLTHTLTLTHSLTYARTHTYTHL